MFLQLIQFHQLVVTVPPMTCTHGKTHGVPRDALHARFGCPTHSKDADTLQGMALTVEAVWAARRSTMGRWTNTVYRLKGQRRTGCA